ncbi:flagellin [Clostridium uliginosum]|uniref:Flagellin n=1 Tax=Clostridium uliginosum TaxID=119641 RepID=A0A1I1KJK6_9CLOT|nr:flagellin [Clostridium uliginosum]SFC60949.1 flagellin [Clostridium uliginosum]
MRLNPNMFSLNIYKNYKNKLADNSKAIGNISSGIKLNKAKDNPNKISQSESLKIQILSSAAVKRNIEDTNSMIQTFDSAMGEMNDSLLRMKELTTQAASGTLTTSDRDAIQLEIDGLNKHIDYMANNTEFNGIKLINENGAITSTVGIMQGESTSIPKYDLTSTALGIKGMDITDPSNINSAMTSVDNAINQVLGARGDYGALQLRFESSGENMDENSISLQKAQSNIADADIAEEMIKFSQSQILIQSSIALMAQSNNFPQDALKVLQNIK